ncbi:MAG: hypothetical protein GC162_00310 [Planctomycetes bacterium]|nr:hypothetical protein [Planctomycetota bacterium]
MDKRLEEYLQSRGVEPLPPDHPILRSGLFIVFRNSAPPVKKPEATPDEAKKPDLAEGNGAK